MYLLYIYEKSKEFDLINEIFVRFWVKLGLGLGSGVNLGLKVGQDVSLISPTSPNHHLSGKVCVALRKWRPVALPCCIHG